jgi:hypothetical protein
MAEMALEAVDERLEKKVPPAGTWLWRPSCDCVYNRFLLAAIACSLVGVSRWPGCPDPSEPTS